MVQPPPPPGGPAALTDGASKVAVTVAEVLTTQTPVPVQPLPLQPVKVDPPSAVAVSVTVVLLIKLALQIAPQSMPVGAETTFPVPVPSFKNIYCKGSRRRQHIKRRRHGHRAGHLTGASSCTTSAPTGKARPGSR